MFKKLMARLHLWLGLFSGIVVFIVSITGCIHVFHEEFLSWFPPKADAPVVSHIASQGRPFLTPSEIVKKLQHQAYGDSVEIQATMIRYKREEQSLLLAAEKGLNEQSWYGFDPYTGELLDHKLETPYGTFRIKDGKKLDENLRGFEFFPFILRGHMYLWLPPVIGDPIVCYGTLIFVLMLISGLVLWWPKNKAAAKQRFWFRWKKSTKWRRKNYDLHNISGFYMFLFLFLIAFTGLCIGLSWVNDGVRKLLGGEEEVVYKSTLPENKKSIQPHIYMLDAVFEREHQLYSDIETNSLYWAYPSLKDTESTIMSVLYTPDKTYRTYFDRYTQNKLGMEDEHEEESLAHQLEHLYLPIHEGSIWGLPTKILAFVASLISASLPVTGFYIWWGRRKKSKVAKK